MDSLLTISARQLDPNYVPTLEEVHQLMDAVLDAALKKSPARYLQVSAEIRLLLEDLREYVEPDAALLDRVINNQVQRLRKKGHRNPFLHNDRNDPTPACS